MLKEKKSFILISLKFHERHIYRSKERQIYNKFPENMLF